LSGQNTKAPGFAGGYLLMLTCAVFEESAETPSSL
jgi:hypothetical protein